MGSGTYTSGPMKLGRMNERILRIEDHKGRTVRRGGPAGTTKPADGVVTPTTCYPCPRTDLSLMSTAAHALHILEAESTTRAQRRPCLGNATQEFRMMFEAILEPVVFRSESDQDASRTTVSSDHDLFIFRQAEVLRQIILDFSQGHRPELACLLRRATLALRLSG